uniref:General transcription factor IIF subunit 2 n=1 Tax=Gorilla gorilla gorilla TaxID=9595 RepID=A0A2I2YRF2_GORGO
MRLKRLQIEESSKPVRLSQQLDKVVTASFETVANQYNTECERKEKKYQYYHLKDLVDITKQPVVYLRELLKEIGLQNVKEIHKNTWELKPEYRHHQGEEMSD